MKQQAGGKGKQGGGNLATVTDVALIGCGGSGWRWRMNLLNSLNRFVSLSVLGMPSGRLSISRYVSGENYVNS